MRLSLLAACALGLAGCTVHSTETPDLTGPSEFALSFKIAATPDSISQDGGSQSSIVVSAFDPNGKPKPGVTFRLDMAVSGQPVDYGTLSFKAIATGSDGRATATYTSPLPFPPGTNLPTCTPSIFSSTLPGGCVEIIATPIGSGFATGTTQSVQIHLLPLGVILPPAATPTAQFTFSPSAPAANSPVQFDASTSCGGQVDTSGCTSKGGEIATYAWDFGDGSNATGRTASHSFKLSQTYSVTLTVTNDRGRAASVTKPISVGAGSAPTASFIYSPTPAQLGAQINFDASNSRPGLGHRITEYRWNWGDGDGVVSGGSPQQDHDFQSVGTFTVVLVVVDEAGQEGTTTQTIPVTSGAPVASFITAITNPGTHTIQADASASAAAGTATITNYAWSWGDGNTTPNGSAIESHAYAGAGTYPVKLTVTDSLGRSGIATSSVVVP